MSETKYPRQYSNVLERCAAQFCMYIDQPKSMFHIGGNPVHAEHEFTTFYISIIHHFTVSSSSTVSKLDETSPCITPLKVGVLSVVLAAVAHELQSCCIDTVALA